jgi:hypothetical protein
MSRLPRAQFDADFQTARNKGMRRMNPELGRRNNIIEESQK